ncbi:hypothetical protein SUDANB1_07103 [Streptomyces sp. enrichment culture]|uniref:hypothetical protein n=1 Tax=Streptomyces sp. enrichment culture TaxID=1795815 RepID=UPI003F5724A5
MNDRLTPEREAEFAAAVAELDADRALSFGTWTASPVTEKTTLPPEQAFAVEDVARMGGATLRGSVGVFGDERHAAFTALARTAVSELLAELAAVRAERDEARESLAFMERNTLPELRRTVEYHQDGKKRWRDRAEKAEVRVVELEAERHTTNEALSDAAEQLRANRERIAELESRLAEAQQQKSAALSSARQLLTRNHTTVCAEEA